MAGQSSSKAAQMIKKCRGAAAPLLLRKEKIIKNIRPRSQQPPEAPEKPWRVEEVCGREKSA